MTISREQFIRGFNAIKASFARREAINAAAEKHGAASFDIGSDPVVWELQLQLEERCRDREDEDGTPWPENEGVTIIEIALMYGLGSATDAHGRALVLPDADAVWAYWQETKSGPFREARA